MTFDLWRYLNPDLGYPFPDMGAFRADEWSGDVVVLVTDTWVHRDLDGLLAHAALLTVLAGTLIRPLRWEHIVLVYLAGGLAGAIGHLAYPSQSAWIFGGGSGGLVALAAVAIGIATLPRVTSDVFAVARVRECLPPLVLMAPLLLPPGGWGPTESSTGSIVAGLAVGAVAVGAMAARGRSIAPAQVPRPRWGLVVAATLPLLVVAACMPGLTWEFTHRSSIGGEIVMPVVLLANFVVLRVTARASTVPPRVGVAWTTKATTLTVLAVHVLLVFRALAMAHPWRS